jgi:hypothetical protein
MARTSHKERIWEQFAQQLSEQICLKFMADQRIPLKQAINDFDHALYVKYVKPHVKAMEKLPAGFVRYDKSFSVSDGSEYKEYRCELSEDCLVPYKLTVLVGELDKRRELGDQWYVLNNNEHKLRYDLFNNIIAAESFAEVVEKWPEAKELAEEVAITYTQSMNQPLSKILGKYTPDKALPAPKK